MKNRLPQIEIKNATVKDLNDILRLNFELFKKERQEYDKLLDMNWTYTEGKKYFLSRITKKDGFVIVAKYKKKSIGYLCGGVRKMEAYRIQKKYAELENMFLEKKFRGQGLGTKLAQKFFDWCRENKIERVSVSTSFMNNESVRFYEKLGFKGYTIILEMKLSQK